MENVKNSEIENKIFFSKYKTDKKIGEGSFGRIYSGIYFLIKILFTCSATNIKTNEKIALKIVNLI